MSTCGHPEEVGAATGCRQVCYFLFSSRLPMGACVKEGEEGCALVGDENFCDVALS